MSDTVQDCWLPPPFAFFPFTFPPVRFRVPSHSISTLPSVLPEDGAHVPKHVAEDHLMIVLIKNAHLVGIKMSYAYIKKMYRKDNFIKYIIYEAYSESKYRFAVKKIE